MIRKLGLSAVLATLALTMSACLIVDVDKPDHGDKPEHHLTASPST